MSDIQIEKEIVMRKINTVRPYVRNPRRNDKTVELLCKLIPKVGFNVPLVIDEKGIIVKGHARFSAAIRLGMEEVPCIITHADEEAIKADRITDNKISEFSEWVNEELISEINDLDFDLSELGLPKIDLSSVPTSSDIEEQIADQPTPVNNGEITEAQREQVYKEFLQEQEKGNIPKPQANEDLNEPYYKLVCEKCGCIMFLKESEVTDGDK